MYAEAIKKKAEKEAAIELPQNWTGTGFALNNSYVVTNYHVIENAKKITLKGINGNFSTQYTASVAASDKKNDLDEKANEHRKKLEELAAKYRKLTEKRELTLKRLAKAFPKLSLESTAELKERFAKIKDELKRK